MGKTYVRQTTRASWSETAVATAMDQMTSGEMGAQDKDTPYTSDFELQKKAPHLRNLNSKTRELQPNLNLNTKKKTHQKQRRLHQNFSKKLTLSQLYQVTPLKESSQR